MKHSIALLVSCLALLFCIGMTPQEQAYREAECHPVGINSTGGISFECCSICPSLEILKEHTPEWDIPIEPEPTCVVKIENCSLENCESKNYYWYNDMCNLEPECIPEWCSAPLISCGDTPIEGFDSCGEKCIKPSATWKHCLDSEGNMVDWDG